MTPGNDIASAPACYDPSLTGRWLGVSAASTTDFRTGVELGSYWVTYKPSKIWMAQYPPHVISLHPHISLHRFIVHMFGHRFLIVSASAALLGSAAAVTYTRTITQFVIDDVTLQMF
ncbi:hypothetical protein OBBRIDRAFT_652386 [Obba rivulosa]|uniref:Uncharacterized protein n=1 Tax=Obba rivulosa TaxID=1052685 RepID=A0A8E2AX15_9APHY|nr:hypothetical protein OBBRIDRAFT_652386 [Obba rivulosa]